MWTVLPAKNFCFAKQRLAGLLTPDERRNLFQAMLEDVLAVLGAHPLIEGVVLVSDDPTARMLSKQYGTEFLDESTLGVKGLNPVIQAAVHTLAARGIHEVMVIHGDLPLISTAEVSELITTHRRGGQTALTIAPDRQREGTNCLICTPASEIAYCYGQASFTQHVRQAAGIGATVQIVPLAGISFDVDWPADVLTLSTQPDLTHGKRTMSYLKESGIAARAIAMVPCSLNAA